MCWNRKHINQARQNTDAQQQNKRAAIWTAGGFKVAFITAAVTLDILLAKAKGHHKKAEEGHYRPCNSLIAFENNRQHHRNNPQNRQKPTDPPRPLFMNDFRHIPGRFPLYDCLNYRRSLRSFSQWRTAMGTGGSTFRHFTATIRTGNQLYGSWCFHIFNYNRLQTGRTGCGFANMLPVNFKPLATLRAKK